MIPFMRAPGLPGVKRVIGIMPSQGGKSNGIFNIIGNTLDESPVPVLYIAPTKSLAQSVVEPKIDSMLRQCATLWDATLKGKKYTTFRKRVNNVDLRLAWGGSTTEMKGDTAFLVCVDEIDEFDSDIGGQGNILVLADARHASYEDGITVAISTPTEGNIDSFTHPITGLVHWQPADFEAVISQIWRAWQSGTRHEWAWPCPECRNFFIPRFNLLVFDSKATQREIELAAHVACPNCGSAIPSSRKQWMNEHGVMIAPGQYVYPLDSDAHVDMVDAHALGEVPDRKHEAVFKLEFGNIAMPSECDSTDITQWTSGLAHYSLARSFGAIAWDWLRATRSGDPDSVKGVLNTVLAECFRFGGDAPDWEEVAARKLDYSIGDVHDDVTQCFVTVDVQHDRLVYVVRGWTPEGHSYLIDCDELWGETQNETTFQQLMPIISRDYGGMSVRAVAVDSGFRTFNVYEFCRKNQGLAVPTKGELTMDRYFYASKVDVKPDGRSVKYSVQLWHINTDMAKSWVHSRMAAAATDPLQWYLPGNISEYYMRQIVAERRDVLPSGRVKWHKTGRNDYLDCEGLQWFLWRCLGPVAARVPVQSPRGGDGGPGPGVINTGIEV